MTWSYFIKRICWLIPTVWMVLAIAFVLKHAVPGDPVESVLLHRGISAQDMERHQSSYEKIYREEKFHWPVFYFSLVPSHYPGNIHEMVSPERKKTTGKLLKQGYPYPKIQEFLDSCQIWKQKTPRIENDATRTWKHQLNFDADPVTMVSLLRSQNMFESVDQQPMISMLDQLIQSRITVSRPSFHWHGSQNQFHNYIRNVVSFNFGTSALDGKPATRKITSALSWTVVMIVFSLSLLFLISIPLGLWSGRYEGSRLDQITEKLSVFLYSVPVFWLASMLIIFFTSDQYGSWMFIFPSVGTWYVGPDQGFWETLWYQGKHLILPVLCLTANDFAFLIRLIKVNTIAEKNKPYIKVAIARGLTENHILWKQVLPNVSVSIIAVLIGLVPAAFAGSLIIEVIFNIPGMGRLLYHSLQTSDWNVVFAILILLSLVTILFNLVGDILIARLNPKIRYGKA